MGNSGYIDVTIDTDPQDIMDDFVTFMQTAVPGWQPSPGQLDVWLMQAVASAAADTRDVASAVPKSIFRWFGANLLNFPPIDDTPASVTATWTVVDNAGYTVPAGTQVSIARTGDDVYAFETTVDTVIAPGATTAAGVQLAAVTPGSAASGLGGAGIAAQLIDPLTFVSTVVLEGVTVGGVDAEDDDTYLTRLRADLQLLAPRPILPPDFAVFARQIPGVYRATAIDGYNPTGPLTGQPRTISIAAIDANGSPLDTAHKNSVLSDLEARREVNFQIFVIDPTLNIMDITYSVQSLAGYDTVALKTAIDAALTNYLSAATWGALAGDPSSWSDNTTVRYLEVAQVINDVAGVDYITTTAGNLDLQIGIHGGSLVRTDVALTGVAPLPTTVGGTITGTVS